MRLGILKTVSGLDRALQCHPESLALRPNRGGSETNTRRPCAGRTYVFREESAPASAPRSPTTDDRVAANALTGVLARARCLWRRSGRPARPRRSPKAGPPGGHTESPWCVGSPVLVAPRNVLMALGSAEPRGPGPSSASAGQLHAAGLKRGAARVSHEEARRRRRRRGQWAGVPRSRSVRRTLRLQFSSPIEAVAPVSIRVEGTALWKSSDRNLVARRVTRESGRVPRPASQFWGTTRRPSAPRRPRSGWPGLPRFARLE
jgi:hypothetical protein